MANGFQVAGVGPSYFKPAEQNFMTGLAQAVGVGAEFVQKVEEHAMKLELRKKTTQIRRDLRQRYVDDITQRRGQDVTKLLTSETQRVDQDLNNYLEGVDNPALQRAIREQYSNLSGAYLNKVGAFQIGELDRQDTESRDALQDEMSLDLTNTSVGNTDALEEFYKATIDNIGERAPNMVQEKFEAGVIATAKTWAADNPVATRQWWSENKDWLRTRLGAGYTKVKSAIDTAINNQQTELLRQQKLLSAQKKIADGEVQTDFVTKLANGTLSVDEILGSNLDAVGAGGKQWWIEKLTKRVKDEDTIHSDNTIRSAFMQQAYGGDLDMDSLWEAVDKREISVDHAREVVGINKTVSADADKPYIEARKRALQYIHERFIKPGVMAQASVDDVDRAYFCQQELVKQLSEMSAAERMDALAPTSQKYIVNKIVSMYQVSDIDRMRKGFQEANAPTIPQPVVSNVSKMSNEAQLDSLRKRFK